MRERGIKLAIVKFFTFVVLLREMMGCHFMRKESMITPIAHMSTADPCLGELKMVSGGMYPFVPVQFLMLIFFWS
jgi:hypothetical protein